MARYALFFFVTFLLLEYCESNKALRKLNSKFNLLKRKVERDISDLQYEVADLQAELALEKSRASALEVLLNSSDVSIPDLTGSPSLTTLQKRVDRQGDTISKLETDVERMKKENTKLQKLSDVTKIQEKDLSNIKASVKKQNADILQLKTSYQTDSKNISVLSNKVTTLGVGLENTVKNSLAVVSKAFSDEKKQLRELLKNLTDKGCDNTDIDIDVESVVENLLNSSVLPAVHDIHESCGAVQKQVADLETDLSQVRKELKESSEKISSNEVKLKVLNDTCKAVVVTSKVNKVTTVRPITPTSSSTQSHTKNYTVYAVFGEDIPKNIRIGSRVIRGKNWAWRDQDGGGPGTVTTWTNSNKEVIVQWDAGRKANYRVGLLGLYDLYIITGGPDEHLREAGVPKFKPVFKGDLETAITIGTRVIRGEDWSWREQDAGGPGTVVAWYQSKKSSRQVMVKWDKAREANYRVGAHGKYDLFILANN